MGISRRDFLKFSGLAALGGAGAVSASTDVEAMEFKNKLKGCKVTTSICPYCAVGCGLKVYSKNGKVVHVEGDPDHPINEGRLCPKGSSVLQLIHSPYRELKPKYRAPYSSEWKEVEWDWALDQIAKRIKQTRDKTFEKRNKKGQIVNRTQGIGAVGSAALDNEECFILQKWWRSLGLIYIEHQARI